MVYRGALEKRCGFIGHRGFESHPLRLRDIRQDVLFFYRVAVISEATVTFV